MKFAVLALTLLLAVASQAAAVPEEPSDIQQRVTAFKSMVAQLKDVLDRTIAVSPDAHELQTPSALSDALGYVLIQMQNNEDAVVDYISVVIEMFSQMTGAGEFSEELRAAVANLVRVLKEHLAEYNVLLTPIIQDFKRMSMQFSAVAAPKIANLRIEFRANAEETINALGPVVRTILKMGKNFKESVDMQLGQNREAVEQALRSYESLSEEERSRRWQEIFALANTVVAKIQKIHEIYTAPAPTPAPSS